MEQMEQMIDRGLTHANPTIRDNKEKKKKLNQPLFHSFLELLQTQGYN